VVGTRARAVSRGEGREEDRSGGGGEPPCGFLSGLFSDDTASTST
jgi:hypothetical protein